MRWIESRAYSGPDRRERKVFCRWFERRKKDQSMELPAVQVMLRQLHLRVLDVETAREQLAQFDRRLEVAADLLQRAGEAEAVTHLAVVRQKLRESGKKGGLKGADATEVQERTAAALCALKAIG
ncbi:MAG: hypothetical protein H7124_11480 [Phycisphaerales bacterium]|nr:hypothetical protein [Hyphomonadaceae bacterium]